MMKGVERKRSGTLINLVIMLRFILLFLLIWFGYKIFRGYRTVKKVMQQAQKMPFPPSFPQQMPFQPPPQSGYSRTSYPQHTHIEDAEWEEVKPKDV